MQELFVTVFFFLPKMGIKTFQSDYFENKFSYGFDIKGNSLC